MCPVILVGIPSVMSHDCESAAHEEACPKDNKKDDKSRADAESHVVSLSEHHGGSLWYIHIVVALIDS